MPGEGYDWDNAAFANHLARFILSGFKESLFTKRFYNRLCNEFSCIAHYNKHGFWETFFTTTADQLRFLKMLADPPLGAYDPIELVVGRWVRQEGLIARYAAQLAQETEARERLQLAALKQKYEEPAASEAPALVAATPPLPPTPSFVVAPPPPPPATRPRRSGPSRPTSAGQQLTLF